MTTGRSPVARPARQIGTLQALGMVGRTRCPSCGPVARPVRVQSDAGAIRFHSGTLRPKRRSALGAECRASPYRAPSVPRPSLLGTLVAQRPTTTVSQCRLIRVPAAAAATYGRSPGAMETEAPPRAMAASKPMRRDDRSREAMSIADRGRRALGQRCATDVHRCGALSPKPVLNENGCSPAA
jgi:hypothetical protein